MERSDLCLKAFSGIPELLDVVDKAKLAPRKDPATIVAACELVLEGLVAHRRISRSSELGYARVRPPGGHKHGLGGSGIDPDLFQ
jgi:magnesium chelatase subunit I